MLVICPTADYEIYLGRNFLPPKDVLFEPTRKLLELWSEFGLNITLFPDICSVWRHRECGESEYADAFEEQLRQAAKQRHDIQLHIHPEWLNAVPDSGTWRFKDRTGSLHDLGFDALSPSSAGAVIRRGVQYLENLLQPLDSSYRCLAFRAGGWILQPEKSLLKALRDAGIRVDATVIPGSRLLRTDYDIDFRQVPRATSWYLDPVIGLSSDSGNPEHILEISIGAYRGSFHMWVHAINQARLRRRAQKNPEQPRGRPIVGMGESYGFVEKVRRKLRKLRSPRVFDMADTRESMLTIVESYLRNYDCVEEDHVICMNGHPKDTYDLHLRELRSFLDSVKERYADRVRFDTLRGVAAKAGVF